MADINIRKLNLAGYTVDRIVNNYQPLNPKKTTSLMTQKGVEDLVAKMPGGAGFPIAYQHKLNVLFDTLIVNDENYDLTYNISVNPINENEFTYPEDCLENTSLTKAFLASRVSDPSCNVRTFNLDNPVSSPDVIDVIQVSTEELPDGTEYVTSFKIQKDDGSAFTRNTRITLKNRFFSLVPAPGTINDYILLRDNASTNYLFSDKLCQNPIGYIDISDVYSGNLYDSDVCYLYVKENSTGLTFDVTNVSLTVDKFNDWKNSKTLTPDDFTPKLITVSNENIIDKIIVSPELKDLDFEIGNYADLWYHSPRLSSVSITGESSGVAEGAIYINETYIEAGLEKMNGVTTSVKNLKFKNIYLRNKFFNGVKLEDASTGDFGDWSTVDFQTMVIEPLSQVATVDMIKNLLNISSGDIIFEEY